MILFMSYKLPKSNGASHLFLLDFKPNCETHELVTYNLPLATFNSPCKNAGNLVQTTEDNLGGLTLS